MKGTFKITYDYLREIGACHDGLRDFKTEYPDGGEYQEILDRCCAKGRSDFAQWLLNKFGPTEDVRVYKEQVSDEKLDIVFAGRIEFKIGATIRRLIAGEGIEAGRGIKAGEGIEAGWGIKAGRGIEAGEGIEAGWGIEAGRGIEAGWGIKAGWGIEAGRGIKAGWGIKAGEGIEAGWGIKAGRGIEAGEGIEAGWGIEAGEGIEAGTWYGIFAGIRVKVPLWMNYAKVKAKSKPENLISGFWEESKETV